MTTFVSPSTHPCPISTQKHFCSSFSMPYSSSLHQLKSTQWRLCQPMLNCQPLCGWLVPIAHRISLQPASSHWWNTHYTSRKGILYSVKLFTGRFFHSSQKHLQNYEIDMFQELVILHMQYHSCLELIKSTVQKNNVFLVTPL